MKMNKKIVIGIALAFLLLAAIGFTYAYFALSVDGNEDTKDQIVETGTLSLVYKDGPEVSLNNAYPGNSVTKTFTITNTGTLDATYEINLSKLINTITNNELVVEATCTSYIDYVDSENKGTVSGTCAEISQSPITESNLETTMILKESISILPEITHEYTLKITFIETNNTQNYNQGKTFFGVIYINESEEKIKLIEKIRADNTLQSDVSINFGEISNNLNGKGLYYTSDLTRTEGGVEVLYYRGAVTNNYVVFADHCWKIVRTNEDGSIKMRYQGEASISDDTYTCNTNTMAINSDSSSPYNVINDSSKYVGYTFDTSVTDTTQIDSIAKEKIDIWYENNIKNKGEVITSLVADTPYCNDRSTITESCPYETCYGAYNRVIINKKPQYKCPQEADKYTVSTSIGNGKLKYPIALLTVDEVAYAGAINGMNNSLFYLKPGGALSYWTMSPSFSGSSFSVEFYIAGGGGLLSDGNVDGRFVFFPAISLIPEVTILKGTGTNTDPYVIG